MRVLVTRPAAQAREWVERLRAHGLDAEALPLIGIEPAADAKTLREAWVALDKRQLAVFVSPNAVEQFFALRPAGMAWPAATRAASPGPGTTRVLLQLGVPRDCLVEPAPDAAQFDSESLWAELAPLPWQGTRVLIVRGDGGRGWLAERLRGAGAEVQMLAAYRRGGPPPPPPQPPRRGMGGGRPPGRRGGVEAAGAGAGGQRAGGGGVGGGPRGPPPAARRRGPMQQSARCSMWRWPSRRRRCGGSAARRRSTIWPRSSAPRTTGPPPARSPPTRASRRARARSASAR